MPRQPRIAILAIFSVTFFGGCFSQSDTESVPSGAATSLQLDQVIGAVKTDDAGQLIEVDYRNVAATNEDLKLLSGQRWIKVIKLSGKDGTSKVNDEGVSALSGLQTLKVLALDFLPVTSNGIAAMTASTDLRELLLAKTDIRDQALGTIAGFEKLTKLRVAGTAITDNGIAKLATLPNLKSLDVSECQALTDDSAATFAKITSLQQLNLWRVPITDVGLNEISKLKRLESLNLDNTKVTDAGLASIGAMTNLTFLHLGSTTITDDGLVNLESLVNLKDLIVTRTGVTEAGVERLQSKLPGTKIQLQYEGDQ